MNNSTINYRPTTLTIRGKSYEDISAKLYGMYGTNYRIIDSQPELKGGFLGLFQKEFLVVTYVLMDEPRENEVKKDEPKTESDEWDRARKLLLENSKIDTSLYTLNNLIKGLADKVEKVDEKLSGGVHPTVEKIKALLKKNEFPDSYIDYISERIEKEFSLEKLGDFDFIQRKVVDMIGESILIAPDVQTELPNIVVLVGPTGAGKTTTIGKLAASPIIEAKRNGKLHQPVVRLITTDHTRVGAEEQLKKFGDLLYSKVEKAESSEGFQSIIESCKNSAVDYIFVDSSGYSPNDCENIAKMKKILNLPGNSFKTHLVVSASTKASDLETIIDNFSLFNFNSVIVTKCDETSCFGNVLGVLHEKRKGISYITTGQKVPRDIEKAKRLFFLERLKGFNYDKNYLEDKFLEDN